MRLTGFDYSWPRIYFVTINAFKHLSVFDDSRVTGATINCLKQLRKKFGFTVYIFCLMPDHFHAMIGPGMSQRTLGAICGAFKSLSTKEFWHGITVNCGSASITTTLFEIVRISTKRSITFI